MKNTTAANALTILANVIASKAIDIAEKAIASSTRIERNDSLMQRLSAERFYLIAAACEAASIDDPASYNDIESELHSAACKILKTGIAIVDCNGNSEGGMAINLQNSLHFAISSFADCGVAFNIVTEIVHPACIICYIDPTRIADLLQCLADQWEDAASCTISEINLPA